MLSVLAVTFPFFALVLCGYMAARRQALPTAAIPGLNGFVLFFALPCMLFRFGSRTPVAQLLDLRVFVVYLACALAMVGLALWFSRRYARLRWNDSAWCALVAAFPNTGFMGVPLLATLLGPSAAGPAILTIVIDMVITTSLCTALSRLDSAGSHGSAVALRQALRSMLGNPLPWAILLGVLASATGVALPGPVAQTVGLLADAAAPTALFTIGAVLARSQMGEDRQALPWRDYGPVALAKLVLHPLLVLGASLLAAAVGWPLPATAVTAVVLVAALPSASNVSLLAERYGAHTGRIARIILVSTALAFLSFSGAVALLRQ